MRSGVALIFAALSLAAAASAAGASPEPVPELVFGDTPAQGCPRFFIGLTPARVDACADRLGAAGWGLSAVAYRGRSPDSDAVDLLAGAFEPRAPKRWVERDDEANPAEPGFVVDVVAATDHLILLYQRGTPRACEDLTLSYPHDFHVADERAYFTAKMSERAAAGCIPGAY
jgi:hypothetical protein